jgi:hypothetical protein
MKFDNGIAKKYRQSIEDAFDTIINKGNKQHRFIIEQIIISEMIVCVFPVSRVNASGITGITNPDKTNKRILSERLSLHEALGETFITIAAETIDTGFQRGCEGTFVHEGRHAYDFARAVASFSNADNEPPFNPTLYELEWEAHQTAGEYLLQIGKDEYIQEGLDLLLLGELNGKYYVNDKGIKKRLKDSYGLSLEGNHGKRVADMIGLKIRGRR